MYNNVKHPDRDGYVNHCGSHVVLQLLRLKNVGMDLHAYYEFMQSIKDEFTINYNVIVARIHQRLLLSCCFFAAVRQFVFVEPSLLGATLVWRWLRVCISRCRSTAWWIIRHLRYTSHQQLRIWVRRFIELSRNDTAVVQLRCSCYV